MPNIFSNAMLSIGSRGLLAVVAVFSATILTAAPSYALSESQIKSDCEQNAGGHYSTYVRNGKRISQCCYKDIRGTMTCDYYVNGNYDGTQEWNKTPPPPDTTPPGPPPGVMNPNPPAGNQGPPDEGNPPPAPVAIP
jgi:hypothetical protein